MKPFSAAKLRFSLPPDLGPVAALGVAFMGYLIWNQAYWWSALEENFFGWLTPLFVAFILFDRRERIAAAWVRCAAAGSPRAAGWRSALLTTVAAGGFVLGLLAFLAGALDRAGAGPGLKGTSFASAGVSAILLFLPWLAAPRSPRPAAAGLAGDARWSVISCLIFPATVWLLSAPLIAVIESQLSLYLLNPMIGFVSFVFDLLGLPLGREGNILIMPDHGRVGVEEACSGIRSLTACLFAGSFLGSVFLRPFWQKCVLVVAATVLALGMNLLRSLFLSAWAYRHGTASIEGAVHDTAGYAVLVGTAAGLFALLALFNRPARRPRAPADFADRSGA